MDYEKKYKEALTLARSYYDKDSMNAFLDTIFSELAESEDERMIKAILSAIRGGLDTEKFLEKHGTNYEEVEAYLEKQKELFESGRGLYYYDGEKTTYCGYPATEENPYDFAMSQQEVKQKEQSG